TWGFWTSSICNEYDQPWRRLAHCCSHSASAHNKNSGTGPGREIRITGKNFCGRCLDPGFGSSWCRDAPSMRELARTARNGASVGRRLFLLVGCQTAIAAILVLTALRTIFAIADDYRHMYEFQFKSVYAVRKAVEKAVGLQSGFQSDELEAFY